MRVAVTGAFGYSGRYMAARLLAEGHEVLTLTNSLHRPNPFGTRVTAVPFHFEEPEKLTANLRGVEALINTYWVRFDHRLFTHEEAVRNSATLFEAARRAGVRRVVHVSITNPDARSRLPYFAGKARVEAALAASGVSHAILRPTVLFGREDVLINNIAWALRRFPVYGLFGQGDYRLQPIYVEDLATAAVAQLAPGPNVIINAIGPETFTYRALVATIARVLGVRRWIAGLPPALAYWGCRMAGWWVRDVVVTREEIQGLLENRLYVDAPPLGQTKLSEWIRQHRETLGRRYTSEMARRVNRHSAYQSN